MSTRLASHRLSGTLRPSGFFALRTPLLPFDEVLEWGENDAARLRARLDAAFSRPELREALFLGSPDLEEAIEIWRRDPGSGRGPGLERALVRYFVRMASRPTPFGLFGGISVGVVGPRTRLVTVARDRYRRHTRLDIGYLTALAGPDLAVPVTGPEALAPLVERMAACGSGSAARLAAVGAELLELDGAGLGVAPERYRAIAGSLAGLGTPVEPARLFQVDLVKPAPGATLGMPVIEEIRRGVGILHRLARRRPRPDLDRFRQDFERRYRQREVPLMEALDHDLGIGFGRPRTAEPLLEGLSFPDEDPPAPVWGRREDVLLRKLTALAPGQAEIALDRDDIDQMAEADPPPLPDALSVLASVAAADDGALDRGDFQVLVDAAGGPSGAWMLGRFCHADPELRAHVERHLAEEEAQDPDAVWAEIVHLPAGKWGNVVLRPVLRSYEIPCLGTSGARPERQIPMSDLCLSLREGRLVLRSKRLGRRVIPRLTSAHNFGGPANPPAYRFLCALQVADVLGGVAWSWGPLAEAPFLPRVRIGRVVLARARWRVGGTELRALGRAAAATEPLRHVDSWRADRGLPRLVSLVEGDHTLLVDLANVLSVESFADLVHSRDVAWLEELFPGPDQLCARGPEGAFVHQIVVPFLAGTGTAPVAGTRAASPDGGHVEIGRVFPPGSEWRDAKLYAPASVLDAVLLEVVAPLRTGGWHFERGRDPDRFLRARFHGRPDLEAALGPLVAGGRVWRLQLDTYEREVERYGGPEAMLLAERVFSADSDAAVELLRGSAPDERWRLAVAAGGALLDDLGLAEADKLRVVRRRRQSLARQLRVGGELEGQLSRLFRRERPTLEAWTPDSDALRARSAVVVPVAGELRHLERSGRLSVPVPEVAGHYVDGCLNRLLPTARRRQQLVVYDFLGRLLLSRSARGG